MAATELRFRSDIQGLRAVAVVPIVLYHAGIEQLPGGFLGVDIFFVISGYLITRIIAGEMERGEFTFLGFYKRRAIRIFPALIVMLVLAYAMATLLLYPVLLKQNALAGLASAAFVANIFFYHNINYFAPTADNYFYLHTWSLGVEEQFYIFYPILLIALMRFCRPWLRPAIVAVIGLSFFVALLWFRSNPAMAFFLLPSRAWQLGIGAAVAFGIYPPLKSAVMRQIAACAGLATICGAILVVSSDWRIPAPWGLLPCLGAALLIAYGEKGPTAKLLSLWPLTWLGAISYSLYLWHWPIMALWRLTADGEATHRVEAALVIVSIGAGAASYYGIEKPCMRLFRPHRAGPIVAVGSALLIATGCALVVASWSAARLSPFSPEVLNVARYLDYIDWPEEKAQFSRGTCFTTFDEPHYDAALCARQIAGKPTLVLLGDSHAAQYYGTLRKRFPNHNLLQVTGGTCNLLVDGRDYDSRCDRMRAYFYGDLLANRRIDRVIIAERWTDARVSQLSGTIAYLHARNVKVTVIGPVEELDGSAPMILANALRAGDMRRVEKHRQSDPVRLEQELRRNVLAWGADYYSVQDIECPNRKCHYFASDGAPIHFDGAHVTGSGADFLLSRFPRY